MFFTIGIIILVIVVIVIESTSSARSDAESPPGGPRFFCAEASGARQDLAARAFAALHLRAIKKSLGPLMFSV